MTTVPTNTYTLSLHDALPISRNLYLSKVAHKELKTLTKLHILEKRRSNRIQFGTAETMVKASWALSIAIDSKPVTSVTTSDIYDAERIIAREYGIATASRIAAYLRTLANWLGATFGLDRKSVV